MLVFPQLSTGASGQFPLARTRSRRTVSNDLEDGSVIRLEDETGEVIWDLELRELSSAERGSIEALFTATEGRLRPFTFLDPAGNLLRYSEEVTNEAWTKDPLLLISSGVEDHLGTHRATHLANGGQGMQGIRQTLDAPAGFTYCWSVSLKGSGVVTLSFGSLARTFATSETWMRFELGGSAGGTESSVAFRLDLSAAGFVDVFGLQVEAQPGASGYKVTGKQGGVYSLARFGSNELAITAEASEWERTRLRIVAVTEN